MPVGLGNCLFPNLVIVLGYGFDQLSLYLVHGFTLGCYTFMLQDYEYMFMSFSLSFLLYLVSFSLRESLFGFLAL